ncbi:MAG: Mur ligase family protein [Candidatus Gracilibacteria bacterium]|nr:Mur ligase family protein [Candidatus Gracilibacteria bacterium]
MKKLILKYLQKTAKGIIEKHKPFIIGITGTVGKTTTTHFVFEFLQSIYGEEVYMSPYDYNGEYGLPLTILQSKSPNKNIFGWINVFLKGFFLRFTSKYPKYLVLEYGIDHKGEMDTIIDVASPDIGIILNIHKNHVEQFPDFQDYVEEKIKLARKSKKIIYNIDDENIRSRISEITDRSIMSYGIKNQDIDIIAKNIKSDVNKLSFDFCYKNNCHMLEFGLIGEFQAYNILPVFALGITLGVEIENIIDIIKNVNPQKGRGTLIQGMNKSIIIDGSYNGGITSISAGVDYMSSLNNDYNKILFLGDMRELGEESKKIHMELAEKIMLSNVDKVILVGEEMKKYIYEKMVKHFGEQNVYWFASSRQAGLKIRSDIQKSERQSVIFVKGSQNTIFLEEGIKEFIYDIRDISKLCRQSVHWMKIKENFFNNVL